MSFSYDFFGNVCGCYFLGDADRSAVAADLSGFMTPAPVQTIEGWLAELSVITARRHGDEMEEVLRLSAYANRLAQFPADVARYVCVVKTWKFWPTWHEMHEICQVKANTRRRLIMELESGPEPEIEDRKPPTSEERERAMQMIAELFPALARSRKAAADARAKEGDADV